MGRADFILEANDWDEGDHKRGPGGQFAKAGSHPLDKAAKEKGFEHTKSDSKTSPDGKYTIHSHDYKHADGSKLTLSSGEQPNSVSKASHEYTLRKRVGGKKHDSYNLPRENTSGNYHGPHDPEKLQKSFDKAVSQPDEKPVDKKPEPKGRADAAVDKSKPKEAPPKSPPKTEPKKEAPQSKYADPKSHPLHKDLTDMGFNHKSTKIEHINHHSPYDKPYDAVTHSYHNPKTDVNVDLRSTGNFDKDKPYYDPHGYSVKTSRGLGSYDDHHLEHDSIRDENHRYTVNDDGENNDHEEWINLPLKQHQKVAGLKNHVNQAADDIKHDKEHQAQLAAKQAAANAWLQQQKEKENW